VGWREALRSREKLLRVLLPPAPEPGHAVARHVADRLPAPTQLLGLELRLGSLPPCGRLGEAGARLALRPRSLGLAMALLALIRLVLLVRASEVAGVPAVPARAVPARTAMPACAVAHAAAPVMLPLLSVMAVLALLLPLLLPLLLSVVALPARGLGPARIHRAVSTAP
jgi:hypothetical protein